jgi:hypothetical protein
MKLIGLCPRGQLGDEIKLPEQFAHHLTGVIALAQLLELLHDAGERLFGLRDRAVRVVLALPFETLVMLEELFAKEVR